MTLKERLQSLSQRQYSVAMTLFVCCMYAATLFITSDVHAATEKALFAAVFATTSEVVWAAFAKAVSPRLITVFATAFAAVSAVFATAFTGLTLLVGASMILGFAALAVFAAIKGADEGGTSRFSAATTIAVQIAVTYGLLELSNHLLVG